jgi:hypothetical protein
MAMIAITTNSSINVKPPQRTDRRMLFTESDECLIVMRKTGRRLLDA